jgi:hypothetical protein
MTAFGILVKFKRNVAMKKSIITLGAVALALVACNNKEQLDHIQNETVLTFSSEKPQLETETKTAWDATNQSIVWTSGDMIRVGYTLDGTWMGNNGAADSSSDPIIPAKFYASNGVAIDATHANSGTFSVPSGFTGSPTGSAVFYSVYPSSCADTDANYAPSVTVKIKSSQMPGANTFDKDADIMIGQTEAIALSNAFPTTPLALEWNRIVAHADLTFTNLPINGDASVNKITLTFNNEAKVVGKAYVNVTTGVVNSTPASNQLEIRGDNLVFSGANNNNIEAWACVLPVEFTSVDVAVKTNLATYTRSITGISKTFKKNARNTLSINMASSTRTENTTVLDNGNYVLAVKSGETYYAISSDKNASSARRDRVLITTENFNPSDYSVYSPYSAANKLIWTVTNVTGGVKINLVGDTGSYMQGGSNTIPLGNYSSSTTFEVSENSGKYTFYVGSKSISMNQVSGFGFYNTSNGYPNEFYAIPACGTPKITFAETSKDVIASAESVTFSFISAFLSDTPVIAITSDDDGIVKSSSIENNVLTVNLNKNNSSNSRTAILSVSATGITPIELTINQSPIPGVSVATNDATAISSLTGTTATLNGTITLVGGGVIGSVTEAGFYYKLSTASEYTKVTCASVSATSFSYDLTGLTKNATYSYYAYAVYNNGSEVTGKSTEKTFTVTQGNTTDVTYSMAFATIGSTGWTNSYGDHTVVDDAICKIDLKSFSKQTGTITDCPVTKGGNTIITMKDNHTITAVTFELRQWTDKAKTVSLQYSTDGGTNFNAMNPAVSSSTFTLSSSSLPSGTNAVKLVQGNTGNQVGLVSISFTYE